MEDTSENALLLNDGEHLPVSLFQKFTRLFKSNYNTLSTEELEPVPLKQLFRYATKRDIFVYILASTLSFILGIILPFYIYVYSRVTTYYVEEKSPIGNDAFLWKVWTTATFYVITCMFSFIVEFLQHYLLNTTSERIAQRCRSEFITAILTRNSIEFSESTGELSSRLSNHVDRLREGLGEKIGMFVRCISSFISCCVFSFVLDWQTTLFLVWAGPVYIITAAIIPKLSKTANKEVLKVSEEANGISEEAILNVKTVASCNGQEQMIQKYSSSLDSGVRSAVRVAFSSGLLDATSNLAYFAFNSFGMWYATIRYHEGKVGSAGDVFAVVFMALAGSSSFSRLGPHVIALMKARSAAAKIYQTIDSAKQESNEEEISLLDPRNVDLHLEFKNVSFSYPSRNQPVLQSLSFDLQPGKSIGLVGKSGCGKSTTLKLLTRFLDTDFGEILLNGKPLRDFDKKKWRQTIGVVSQEPCLFNGSIRENICLGRNYTDSEVEQACKIAYAHDFIKALDKGYETLLGSSGVSLSGGQKQRIGIARAVISNPRLLLLDEATSALDSKSERIVQEALDNAAQGRSTIVVAHRLSTIKNVDEVVVMEEGRVVERGGYDDLRVKPDGLFSRMVTEQEMERRKSRDVREESSEESYEVVDVDDTEREMVTEQIHEQTFPSMSGGFLALLGRHKGKTLAILLIGFFRGLATPLLALRYLFVFGSLQQDDYQSLLFWLMVGTMGVGCYNFVLQFISQPLCQYIGELSMNDLRVAALRSLLHRPMAYFDRSSTSTSASSVILSQQPAMAMPIMDNKLSIVVGGFISWFLILGLALYFFLPNGILGFVYLITYFFILILFEKFTDKANKEVVEADKSGEVAMEIFDNVATIQQLAVEDYFQKKYEEVIEKRNVPLKRKIRYESVVHATNESIFYLVDYLSTAIDVYFVYLGYYSSQMLFLAENLLSTCGWLTFQMSQSLKEMVSASSAVKLMFNLIDPTLNDSVAPQLIAEGSVKADSLSFSYPSRPDRKVLSDVSFGVERGRSLAFVGPSGGGKSTIVNLLERFYDPISGRLFLDDLPFPSLTPFQLRSNIAMVGQEPVLFRGTISENVALGVEDVSDEEIRATCKLANADQFILDLPEGYATMVGEKGRSLSGGQKQRIAIARALVRQPKVIILDEATSALDSQSEKVVRKALESSAVGRTSVTIAHRLDTIRHCDEICFVEDGRVVERGSHAELIMRRGKYYEMTEQQRLS